MKKALVLTAIVFISAYPVFAADFSPTLLKIAADPVVQYDFDGSDLEIPISVSGQSAGVIFCVFTRGQADQIPDTRNGYLGWHHVNKIDTCVYYSTLMSYGVGNNIVEWDGKDQDGSVVSAGEYTYYMWAFDHIGQKTKVMEEPEFGANFRYVSFKELDEEGLPLNNPLYYKENLRWVIGNDPLDMTLKDTATIPRAEGWTSSWVGNPLIDPYDSDYFYVKSENVEGGLSAVQKWKWVPGGDCELQTDFGEDGYGCVVSNVPSEEPGVNTDGTYLFTVEQNYRSSNDPDGEFYILDYDGETIDVIDLTPWWARPDEFDMGRHMNGGPNCIEERNGYVFLNCHCSCIKQMVSPSRYLETEEVDDFYVWSNLNGDYVLDNQFEETAANPWACNYPVVGYAYTIHADDNLFTFVSAYDFGAVSFGLMAPDGTGLGYFSFAGETAGWKKGAKFVDSGTPFDGIYCDNEQAGGTHYEGWEANDFTNGLFWVGHDSINGIITNAVSVDASAPSAFTVAQNSPNPFNPTTTINFSLVQSGDTSIEVFNVAGQKVDTLVDGYLNAGQQSVVWDAGDRSAGVYFYTVKSGGHSKTMKMTLLR